MTVKLLTEHHLEFQSLEGGYTDSSESTFVEISHCWLSRVAAHFISKTDTLYSVIICVSCWSVILSCLLLAVTCWEWADLLSLLYVMFICVFVTFTYKTIQYIWCPKSE